MRTFEQFAQALALQESGGEYKALNRFGYLGRYQFGLARLTDLGLCRRKPGTTGYANQNFEWIPPHTETEFLNSPILQDRIFQTHIADLRRQLKQFESGLVAAAHLLGVGGVKHLLFEGEVDKDANGTSALDYIKKFASFDLDQKSEVIS